MSTQQTQRTTQQKVELFRSCFTGLSEVYGTYDVRTGRVRQVKQSVTYEVLLGHLQGRQPYGVYLLTGDRTRAIVADFDEEDPLPPMDFVKQASHYGIESYIERSKSKGWHVWIFMELPGLPAAKGRMIVKMILEDIGKPVTEIFPKQDSLCGDTNYGNFINAPLFGRLVRKGRTVFVDPDNGLRPYPNQWDVLENINRVPESLLDDVIEINELTPGDSKSPPSGNSDNSLSFGLPPCARRMLEQGVYEFQRVSCFRLAVHLKKAGLPQDTAVATLTAWAPKNRPQNGKRIITPAEISEQVASAYSKEYRGCGCEDPAVVPYCQPDCPLHSRHASTKNAQS